MELSIGPFFKKVKARCYREYKDGFMSMPSLTNFMNEDKELLQKEEVYDTLMTALYEKLDDIVDDNDKSNRFIFKSIHIRHRKTYWILY